MHDQPSPEPVSPDAPFERSVLNLLLDCDHHGVWSIDELAREIGDLTDTKDAVARLQRAGLGHRCGPFARATRAAAQFDRLPT